MAPIRHHSATRGTAKAALSLLTLIAPVCLDDAAISAIGCDYLDFGAIILRFWRAGNLIRVQNAADGTAVVRLLEDSPYGERPIGRRDVLFSPVEDKRLQQWFHKRLKKRG